MKIKFTDKDDSTIYELSENEENVLFIALERYRDLAYSNDENTEVVDDMLDEIGRVYS